jgi:hypothetical protein
MTQTDLRRCQDGEPGATILDDVSTADSAAL